jgi:hypothetical protein
MQTKIVLLSAHPREKPGAGRELVYLYALAFVNAIEPDPRFSRLSHHYRNRRGELLGTLDQVVNAILDNELMTEDEPVPRGRPVGRSQGSCQGLIVWAEAA